MALPPPPSPLQPPTRAPLAAALLCAALAALALAAAPAAASPAAAPAGWASGGAAGASSDGFFVRHPESMVAPLGDEAALKCVLRFPAERLRWRKDGRLLPPAPPSAHAHAHPHAHAGPVRVSELPLRLTDRAQAGAYQCVAYFGAAARASLPGRVRVAETAPFPPAPPRRLQVPAGCTVALRWPRPAAAPPPLLEFARDGQRLPEWSARARVLEASGALLLVNVSAADAGVYTASASNYITGQRVRAPDAVTLEVLPAAGPDRPPALLAPPPPAHYNVSLGGNVTLECAGAGRPPPSAEVLRYGGELPRARSQRSPAGLCLWGAARADAGTYTCELSNRAGAVRHVITLHVQEPPEIGRLPNMTVIEEGDSMSLDCQARGYPTPELTWIFNGEDIAADDAHIKIAGGHLHLAGAEKRHAGTYQCFASNAAGDAVRSIELQVSPKQIAAAGAGTAAAAGGGAAEATEADRPAPTGAAPTAPTAAAAGRKKAHHRGGGPRRKDKSRHRGSGAGGSDTMIPPSKPVVTILSDTSVMVRWDVPRNKGLPIQFFKVQYREGGRTQRRRGGGGGTARGSSGGPDRRAGEGSRWMTHNEDISEHRRTLKVDNLRPGHIYRFRVAAVYSNNDNKPGPISDKVPLTREVGSDLAAPQLKEALALSQTSLQIRWEYSGSSHAPAQGFYVYYRPASTAGDYLQVTVEGEGEREFTLSHLDPNTVYEVKVQSFNMNSASNFSNIRSQKTMPAPTEEPPSTEAGETTAGQADASKAQLFSVLWPVLGGLAALGVLLLAIFLWCRRRLQSGSSGHQDKLSDQAMQGDAAAVFALNSKNILNGRLPQNGHHPGNKINITTNPLADSDEDKNQNVVEMSSQNNNRSSAGGSASGAGRNSTASDAEMDSHVDSDTVPSDVRNWREASVPGEASEKYV